MAVATPHFYHCTVNNQGYIFMGIDGILDVNGSEEPCHSTRATVNTTLVLQLCAFATIITSL